MRKSSLQWSSDDNEDIVKGEFIISNIDIVDSINFAESTSLVAMSGVVYWNIKFL